jgi:hypothetical protein
VMSAASAKATRSSYTMPLMAPCTYVTLNRVFVATWGDCDQGRPDVISPLSIEPRSSQQKKSISTTQLCSEPHIKHRCIAHCQRWHKTATEIEKVNTIWQRLPPIWKGLLFSERVKSDRTKQHAPLTEEEDSAGL